jgi:hypothetical protein
MVAQELGTPENLGRDSILVDDRATELEGIETPQNPPDDGDIVVLRIEADERDTLFGQRVKKLAECRSITVDYPSRLRSVKANAPAFRKHFDIKNEAPPNTEESMTYDSTAHRQFPFIGFVTLLCLQ